MADAPRRSRGIAALVFAVAALASCWNPVGAPFALVVGLGAVVLAGVARRKGAPPRRAVSALLLGALAAVASAVMLALSAGSVTTDIPGTPVVKARSPEEANRVLDEAAARTRAERERARKELDALDQDAPAKPAEPTPARPSRRRP